VEFAAGERNPWTAACPNSFPPRQGWRRLSCSHSRGASIIARSSALSGRDDCNNASNPRAALRLPAATIPGPCGAVASSPSVKGLPRNGGRESGHAGTRAGDVTSASRATACESPRPWPRGANAWYAATRHVVEATRRPRPAALMCSQCGNAVDQESIRDAESLYRTRDTEAFCRRQGRKNGLPRQGMRESRHPGTRGTVNSQRSVEWQEGGERTNELLVASCIHGGSSLLLRMAHRQGSVACIRFWPGRCDFRSRRLRDRGCW